MKVYRIKHKPTGYFYQPVKGRFIGERTHIGPSGKVYIFRKPRFEDMSRIMFISESICKKFGIEWNDDFEFNEDDFEIIEYECREVKGD